MTMSCTSLRWIVVVITCATLLEGCGGNSFLAPVGKDPRVSDITAPKKRAARKHLVRKGETLYAIAFRYGMDYRKLARTNDILSPYVIYPGQSLIVDPDGVIAGVAVVGKTKTTSIESSNDQQTETKKVETKKKTKTEKQTIALTQNENSSAVTEWMWPVQGSLLMSFKGSGNKGIDISGELGHPVRAAAAGKVVYSGGGLIGFGELIIIKHNKRYLSAYGHNNKLLVKQGAIVKLGQHIANMGRSGTDIIKLHFEIRRDGKPLDPIRYLPK